MNNKKRLIIGLVISTMLFLLIGCSTKDAAENNKITNEKASTSETQQEENLTEDSSNTENEDTNDVYENEDTTDENNSEDTNKENNNTEATESDKDTNKESDKPESAGQEVNADEKIVYLTFDDGPSETVTPRILEILDNYDVKATFFVMGLKAERYPELILQEHNSGHIVANHTYSHDLDYLYGTPDNFMEDVYKCEEVLKDIIDGYDYKLIRFPEGAFHDRKAAHRERVENEGYHYIDWNCINGDYTGNSVPADELVQYVKDTYRDQQKVILLMHDATPKGTTAEALPEIIEFFQEEGYTFKNLEKLTH